MLKLECKDLQNIKIDKKAITKFMGKEKLEIGFFETARYPNGTFVAQVAYFNEFGTLNIPMRPFFRNAINKNIKKWYATLQNGINQNATPSKALSIVGEVARADIVESITSLREPPNAESTIKQKKSTNPLIDTGLMRRSVTYKVKG